MLSTVAVGTDGSPTASEAVAMAVELARRFEARLVLLSAFKDSPGTGSATELQWTSSNSARVREILSRTRMSCGGKESTAPPAPTRAIPPMCWCSWLWSVKPTSL